MFVSLGAGRRYSNHGVEQCGNCHVHPRLPQAVRTAGRSDAAGGAQNPINKGAGYQDSCCAPGSRPGELGAELVDTKPGEVCTCIDTNPPQRRSESSSRKRRTFATMRAARSAVGIMILVSALGECTAD